MRARRGALEPVSMKPSSFSSSSSSILSPLRPPPIILLWLATTSLLGGAAAVENDFSAYPGGSQSCLDSAARISKCTSAPSGAELNDCLCYNHGDFIYETAQCIAAKSPGDLRAVYSQMKENCRGTGDTIAVAEDAYMAKAEQATATTSLSPPSNTASQSQSQTSTPGTTVAPTSSPQQQPADDDESNEAQGVGGNLPMGAKIGIGVGVGFGLVAAALAAWFIWVRHDHNLSPRRRSLILSLYSNPTHPLSPPPPLERHSKIIENHITDFRGLPV